MKSCLYQGELSRSARTLRHHVELSKLAALHILEVCMYMYICSECAVMSTDSEACSEMEFLQ